MPSTPLMDSSSGVATVSAITLGLAPGYCARTTTEGGATSGYSEMGRPRNAISPPRKMSTDSTPAKMGRSMKKRDRFMDANSSGRSGSGRWRLGCVLGFLAITRNLGLGGHGDRLRRHHCTGTHALQAVDDDVLARLEARGDHAQAVNRRAQGDLAVLGLVALAHHHHELLVLVGTHGTLVDQQGLRVAGLAHADAGELAGDERAVFVVEHGAHAHGAALGIDLVVDELQTTGVRRATRGARAHLYGDALDELAGAIAAL